MPGVKPCRCNPTPYGSYDQLSRAIKDIIYFRIKVSVDAIKHVKSGQECVDGLLGCWWLLGAVAGLVCACAVPRGALQPPPPPILASPRARKVMQNDAQFAY